MLRLICTPVSFCPDARVNDNVCAAWLASVAVSVKLLGVGSPRSVNWPFLAASVSETVVSVVCPDVAVMVAPPIGPLGSLTVPRDEPVALAQGQLDTGARLAAGDVELQRARRVAGLDHDELVDVRVTGRW